MQQHKIIMSLVAVLVGAAFPLQPVGIAVTQGMLGLAALILLVMLYFDQDMRDMYRGFHRNRMVLALAGMFVVWMCTVPWSSDPGESLKVLLRTAGYMLAATLIWAGLSVHADAQRKTLMILICCSIITMLIAIIFLGFETSFIAWQKETYGSVRRPYYVFKAYSSLLVCLVPVCIWAGHRLSGKWVYLTWAMVPPMMLLFALSKSRSSMAGIMVMVVAIAMLLVWTKHKYYKLALASLMTMVPAGFAWIWFNRKIIPNIDEVFMPTWLIDAHRQVIWRFTFDRFLEAPWTGHGINRINYVPNAEVVHPGIGLAVLPSHPHNWLLEILSETGVFGFTALLIALTVVAWRLLARYKKHATPQALTLIAICVAFFSASMFNFSIWTTWWLLALFVMYALVSVTERKA